MCLGFLRVSASQIRTAFKVSSTTGVNNPPKPYAPRHGASPGVLDDDTQPSFAHSAAPRA